MRDKLCRRAATILDECRALKFQGPIPCEKPTHREPQPDEFAKYLGDVFGPHAGRHTPVLDMLKSFASSYTSTASHLSNYLGHPEVENVLNQMHCNKDDKAADGDGLVVATLQYG